METKTKNRRILIVDDTTSIHDDVRASLAETSSDNRLDQLRSMVLGDGTAPAAAAIEYEIDSAYQGQEGFEKIKQARAEGRPYALAIVDVRMPPGWDGIETVEQMRKVDPDLQVAICTAYSDYSWRATHDRFKANDWLLILKKPFDLAEVQQLASAMTEKWNLGRQASLRMDELEAMVGEHARQLRVANAELEERNKGLAIANVQLSREISARRMADDRIRHIAFHDALTDLPNRALLMERINCCVERSKRQSDYMYAVLFTDVDDFKLVNDSLGHRVGDELLVQVARTLGDALRTLGENLRPGADTVARLGGDEFVILLDDVKDITQVVRIAERIQEMIHRPLNIDRKELTPRVSMGIALGQNEYDDAVDILRDADTALYHAKENGKGCATLFDRAMRAKVLARMDLENDLRLAIEGNQFVIYYQPIVSLLTGQIESLEALVRWQHPVRGLLPPDMFVPVAEETGLIGPIGELVIEATSRQLSSWQTRIASAKNLSISINLSPRQLGNSGLVNFIDRCLKEFSLEPRSIKLEITETAMMEDLTLARDIIDKFRTRNIEVYLDDFGTGYSSLSILHTLPFSAIKLDRSFVRDFGDIESETTVQAMVMLAKNRNIKLIAEGIETFEQMIQLKDLSCEFGQGYYFSKPAPADETETLLATGSPYSITGYDLDPDAPIASQRDSTSVMTGSSASDSRVAVI